MLKLRKPHASSVLWLACACTLAFLMRDDTRATDPFRPLWDGRTFNGWHVIGGGTWAIENGEIVGTNAAAEERYGHLVTNDRYGDFTIRLKFKSLEGNSGLYFRVAETGDDVGVKGFQAEIDPARDVGGLYETYGREWVVQPTPDQVQKYFKPGAWNEMIVETKGRDVVVRVNGTETARLTGDESPTEGYIALQLHGGQDVEVRFKDIEISVKPISAKS